MKRSCVAERLGLLRIEKAAISQQHGSGNRRAVPRRREHGVQLIQQAPAQPSQIIRGSWRRPGQRLHQSWVPQRCREVDPLLPERSAIIKGSRVAEISYQARASQNLNPFARTNRRRISRHARVKKIGCPQAAVHGPPLARGLHLLEVDVVAEAPRQAQRILAQDPSPAQRLVEIQLPEGRQIRDFIRWNRQPLDLRRCRGKKKPRQQAGAPDELYPPEFQEPETREDAAHGDPQRHTEAVRNVSSNRSRREDPCGNEHRDQQGRKLHARRESRTKASI